MGSITLSKEHGINPSVEKCHCCGKEMGILLFGTAYKDENGRTAEAPHEVYTGAICEDCQAAIESGGIFFIEVRDGESGNNPFRTGRLVCVKEEAVSRMFKGYSKINYMEQSLFSEVFADVAFSDNK